MKEVWKPIKGYEGIYEVSNKGRIKSLRRRIKWAGTTSFRPLRILKHSISTGYPCVTLAVNGTKVVNHIHRIVATAFIPNPRKKAVVDHINNDKLDYRIANLRWVSDSENKRLAWQTGQHKGEHVESNLELGRLGRG